MVSLSPGFVKCEVGVCSLPYNAGMRTVILLVVVVGFLICAPAGPAMQKKAGKTKKPTLLGVWMEDKEFLRLRQRYDRTRSRRTIEFLKDGTLIIDNSSGDYRTLGSTRIEFNNGFTKAVYQFRFKGEKLYTWLYDPGPNAATTYDLDGVWVRK